MFRTKPKAVKATTPAARSAPAPRVPVEPIAVSVESLMDELVVLRADLATNAEKRAENYKANLPDPDELLASYVRLGAMIESREKEILARAGYEAEARYRDARDDWYELCRQRALAVVALRRINREVEAAYRSYCVADGKPSSIVAYAGQLYPYSFGLFGYRTAPGPSGLFAEAYLRECVSHKIISEKEADDNV
jgi:hypothetical protein